MRSLQNKSTWTPLDRFIMRLRWVFIPLALVAMPVFLLTLGYSIKLLWEALPGWMFATALVSIFTVLLGLACLLDDLELRKSARELARGIQPDRQR